MNTFHSLNNLQLEQLEQKLREEIAQNATLIREQRKERFNTKVCNILTCVLLGCVVLLQVCIMSTGMSSGLAQMLSAAPQKTHVDDIEASEASKASASHSVTQASKDMQRNSIVKNGQQLKQKAVKHAVAQGSPEAEMVAEERTWAEQETDNKTETTTINHGHAKEAQEAETEKSHASRTELKEKQVKVNHTLEHGVEGQILDVGSLTAQHPQDLRDISENPFQSMSNAMLQQFSHGFFWVYFPARDLETALRKYTPIFQDFAFEEWKVNAHCWLDPRILTPQRHALIYEERLCDDLKKITFGVEMEQNTADADTKDTRASYRDLPNRSSFDECMEVVNRPESKALLEMTISVRFQRTFPPDQHIEASLIKDFLHDVYRGKIRQIVPGKGDLRRL